MSAAEREESTTESVYDVMSRQLGVITKAQASGCGVSASALSRRVASGEWARVFPGIYRTTAAPIAQRQSALAAALWGGDEALVSHGTAAALWEFESGRSSRLELWVPYERSIRSSEIIVHRGTRLDRADRTMLGGIPITTPTRTLIDVAGRLEDHRLLSVLEDLIRRDMVRADRLAARLRALRKSGRPGGGRLQLLLDQRGDGRPLESALEALVWQLITASGVRLPARQYWVTTPHGRYRLDFAWPRLKLALECEGYTYHGGAARWGKDKARLAELAAARWRVLPVTWDACTSERERVLRWLRASVSTIH
jgi:very-short-patch-repair endonuclease